MAAAGPGGGRPLGNYVAGSCPGCHVAHSGAEWTLGWLVGHEPFSPAAFGAASECAADDNPREEGEEAAGAGTAEEVALPDLSIDPEDGLLTVINQSPSAVRSFAVSVYGARVESSDGDLLECGLRRGDDGVTVPCTTFMLVVAPRTVMDVGYVAEGDAAPEIVSDIKDVEPGYSQACAEEGEGPPDPIPPASLPGLAFPLGGGGGPYLCSQGRGGLFTHFYSGTRHALDLECPVGTPVLAAGDGTVVEVRQSSRAGGIGVQDLFHWNSLMLRLDSGLCVEYVHIRAGSSRVEPGQAVRAGEQLCESGDAGFCPSAHLHLQAHRTSEASAPTVPFCLVAPDGSRFVPTAGLCYTAEGPVAAEGRR